MLLVSMYIQQVVKCLKSSFLLSVEGFVLPSCFVQVRFRKPRHLGRAPTKGRDYFKKYHPTQKDLQEGQFLYDNYNLLLKSLVAGFQEEIMLNDKNSIAFEENVWNEDAYHKMCLTHINAENDRLKALRLERIEQELKTSNTKSDAQVEEDKLRSNEEERMTNIVVQTIEESEHWLTLENMDEKIIDAIDNPINFNFAVNRKGHITARTALVLSDDHEDYVVKEADTA